MGAMRPSLCWSCLACVFKFLNFLLTFAGISVTIYSLWILNRWNRHPPSINPDNLPAPWFVCFAMGAGVILCLVAFTGHVAAEAVSGCCLCFYSVMTTILILLEAALAAYLVIDRHWEEDLPYESTGELESLRAFVYNNADVFKWVAVVVVVIQALSLLFALFLRVILPTKRVDYNSDEDLLIVKRPLLNPQGETLSPISANSKGFHPDIWSARMRQKYGLYQSESANNATDPNATSYPKLLPQ